MNTQTEKMLTTSWNLVRDAGAAVSDAAVHSKVGTNLVKALPKAQKLGSRVKEMVSVGAGLAIARRSGKAALAVARRNPVATAVGAVALAGLGVAVVVARQRKLARERAGNGTAKPKQLSARNMRNGAGTTAAAKKAPAKRAPRARKPSDASTH